MLLKFYHGLLAVCGLLAGVVIALIALSVTIDVIARNLAWFNLPWLIEVAEYTLYAVTFIAAPWVLHQHAHVRVDVLVNALPSAWARWLDLLMNGVGLLISLLLFYYGILVCWDAYSLGSLIFKELIIPEWWLFWVVPFSGLLLVLEFSLRILRGLALLQPVETRSS